MRKLNSLNIKCVKHLCMHLRCSEKQLRCFCVFPDRYYYRTTKLIKGKLRPIAMPKDRFRVVIDRLKTLLDRLEIPDYLHGGVKARSIKTNASPHIHKAAVLNFDIADFFPSVKPIYVYDMFLGKLGCSPDVAHILTRLVTLDGGLPQGSPTSTSIANLIITSLAKRLRGLSKQHDSDYTQFVDDGIVSGPIYLEELRSLIDKIIRQEGFTASPKPHKRTTKYFWEEQTVTGVKVNRGIDAPQEIVSGVSMELLKFRNRIRFGEQVKPNKIVSLRGKIQHISNLNMSMGKRLKQKFRSIETSKS